MSKKNDQATGDQTQNTVEDTEQAAADTKLLEQATAAATKQQFTREELEAKGLDPAPYGL